MFVNVSQIFWHVCSLWVLHAGDWDVFSLWVVHAGDWDVRTLWVLDAKVNTEFTIDQFLSGFQRLRVDLCGH